MTSKEALAKISWRYVNDPDFQEWCNIVKQDLERLEKENEYLKNANEEYQQGNYELSMAYAKLKQAINILKNKLAIRIEKGIVPNEYFIGFFNDLYAYEIESKEEYELLKEVLGNV